VIRNFRERGTTSWRRILAFTRRQARSSHDPDDRVIYDTATGNAYYGADGSGNGATLLFFHLQGAPTLFARDITLFA
jgi:hypothetical protein